MNLTKKNPDTIFLPNSLPHNLKMEEKINKQTRKIYLLKKSQSNSSNSLQNRPSKNKQN
jgi:hypothetical protein